MWNADYISYKGNTNFIRAYQGEELVWERKLHWTSEEFWIENINDYPVVFYANEGTLLWDKHGKSISDGTPNSGGGVMFSFNGGTWTNIYNADDNGQVTIPPHTKMWLYNGTNIDFVSNNNNSRNPLYNITAEGDNTTYEKYNMGGNLHALVYNWDKKVINVKTPYTFYRLFYHNNIVDASKLVLPSTRLTSNCYDSMFYVCRELLYPPVLPATKMVKGCYSNMFYMCDNLIETPELPATTLASHCYYSMFDYCKSLTTSPELPATELAEYCYRYMFRGCESLTTTPELPATTLKRNCYEDMFNGCINLTEAPVLPATKLAEYCYCGMFLRCVNITVAPELPVTELANYCYSNMFYMSGLIKPPVLPATKVKKGCYRGMFLQCENLIEAPELPSMILEDECYDSMFLNCYKLTQPPVLPATTLASQCYDSMFRGCKSLLTAPELPATTLKFACYRRMFQWCFALEKSPVLPARELVDNCYYCMFYESNNIKEITCLATTNMSVNLGIVWWVYAVSSTGKFIKHPDAVWTRGIDGIPYGWTVENYTE